MHTLIVTAATIAQLRITPITWSDVLTLAAIAALICSVRSVLTPAPVAEARNIVIGRTITADLVGTEQSTTAMAQAPAVEMRRGTIVSTRPSTAPAHNDVQKRGTAGGRAAPGMSAAEIATIACLSVLAVAFAAIIGRLSSGAASPARDAS